MRTYVPTTSLPPLSPNDYGPHVARLPDRSTVRLPHAVSPGSLLVISGRVYRVLGWSDYDGRRATPLTAVLQEATLYTIEGQEVLPL